ncbi:hypothetical protein [Phenylobacterium sp.]|uniref:hypothetical protein n=1 Tax=Phenylobacterium sp. TaxID=1871053 RepID=UPI0035628941
MRLPQLFLATALLCLAAPTVQGAPKTPYDRAMGPYLAALDRQCPGRDLQDLSLGDLNSVMEGFDDGLPRRSRRAVLRSVSRECAHSIAGLGCANTGSLLAYERLRLLPKFTAAVCATHWTCKAFADCAQTRP